MEDSKLVRRSGKAFILDFSGPMSYTRRHEAPAAHSYPAQLQAPPSALVMMLDDY